MAAAWIRELIKRNLIAPGVVDERSITEIKPHELNGYKQCHFFAGVAGWSLALRLAGISDDTAVWTGSCPCQPFSVAGEGKGTADERHLWPVFFELIRACNPPLIFGEQVASAAVLGSASKPTKRDAHKPIQPVWFDGICADLETANYACGAADIPAAGVGAPHIRQRLYWGAVRMADALRDGQPGSRFVGRQSDSATGENREEYRTLDVGRSGRMGHTPSGGLGIIGDASLTGSGGHAHGSGRAERLEHSECSRRAETGMRHEIDSGRELESGCACGGVAHTNGRNTSAEREQCGGEQRFLAEGDGTFWSDSYWHPCRDGKYRRVPVESVFFTEFNGLSRLLGAGWDLCIEEISNQVEYYVESTKISRFEILREVWIAVREEALRREVGGPDSVPFPSFLLFAVCQLARNTKQEVWISAQDIAEIEEGTMRVLRQGSGKFEVSSCPPHQRGLARSPEGKPEDPLCELSSEVTPESSNETVQVLFGNVSVEWNVRETLAAIQEIWRRHTDESSSAGLSSDIRAASGIIRASGGFPLASPEGFKVKPRGSVRPGLLKGSGNAIVPQVAAEFVKAFNQSL